MKRPFIMVGWLGRRNEQSSTLNLGKALFELNIVKNTLFLGVFFIALNTAFKRFNNFVLRTDV